MAMVTSNLYYTMSHVGIPDIVWLLHLAGTGHVDIESIWSVLAPPRTNPKHKALAWRHVLCTHGPLDNIRTGLGQ